MENAGTKAELRGDLGNLQGMDQIEDGIANRLD